jgi:hypothetical protein
MSASMGTIKPLTYRYALGRTAAVYIPGISSSVCRIGMLSVRGKLVLLHLRLRTSTALGLSDGLPRDLGDWMACRAADGLHERAVICNAHR